jgi:hypothetical protein
VKFMEKKVCVVKESTWWTGRDVTTVFYGYTYKILSCLEVNRFGQTGNKLVF